MFHKINLVMADRTTKPPGLVGNCSFCSALHITRQKQSKRKRIGKGVYFSSQLNRPSLMVLDMLPPLAHTGAGGELVKSAAIRRVTKIIQLLLGLPREVGIGGVRVKWLYSAIHLSYKRRTVLYCIDCCTYTLTHTLRDRGAIGNYSGDSLGGGGSTKVGVLTCVCSHVHVRRLYVWISVWGY